jgi:linoleoyl-CoA desaturase
VSISVTNIKYDNTKGVEFGNTLKSRVDSYFKARGNNRKATPFMWFKIVLIMSSFWYNWYQLAFHSHSMPVTIAQLALSAILLMTIAYSIAHDAVHGAITGKPKYDNVIYWLTFNVLGANSYLWRYRHNNAHHFIVNIPGWDLDIEGTKLIRFAPHVKWMPIHRYQHIYASFMYMFFTLQWILVKDFKIFFMKEIGDQGQIKHSKWRFAELLLTKVLYFTYALAIPTYFLPYSFGQILTTFILFHFCFSYFLTLSFVYSHIGESSMFVWPDENGKLPHSFYEHQLLTSVDFHPESKAFGFIYGGFNAHVAHHMFPNLSSVHYSEVSKIIKQTTKEFGKAYHELPLPQMVAAHYQFLKEMGKSQDSGAKYCIYPTKTKATA